MCVRTKTFYTINNNEPWFTAKLRQLHQAKEAAYRSGDRILYSLTTAPQETRLFNSWNLQTTQQSSATSVMKTSLHIDGKLNSWPCGAVATTWSWTRSKSQVRSGLQKRLSVPTCPPSKTCTHPESGNGQGKSLQTPHTLDITYCNFSPLVGATEHCSPQPADTETVSSPSPSH